MGGCNSDIDRRHSIAIACPFVSRSNPADMKRRVIKLTAQCLLQVAQPDFASHAPSYRPCKSSKTQPTSRCARTSKNPAEAAPEQVIGFDLLERGHLLPIILAPPCHA
jgi:hypothetical protein